MDQIKQKPKGFLLLHNIGKRKNQGTLIRSACAFNLEKVFLIGKDENKRKFKVCKEFQFFGNQGTTSQIDFSVFANLKEAKQYFVDNKITVCGVEISQTSESILKHPFRGDTVFLFGNEGAGLLECHRQICDQFIYIPQYTTKTASLNVSCAGSIIFHHFAIWAGYEEAQIMGEKFKDQEQLINKDLNENQQIKDDEDSEEDNNENSNSNQNKKKVCVNKEDEEVKN